MALFGIGLEGVRAASLVGTFQRFWCCASARNFHQVVLTDYNSSKMGFSSPSRPSRAPFLALALLLAWTTLCGCVAQKAPDLLNIQSVGPTTLERGSELRVSGDGFPEGRKGTLTLEGTAYAAARSPRHVSWSFSIVADSRTSVSHRVTEQDLREHLRDATHVTFSGKAQLHFPPALEGRPPLSGSSPLVELDLFLPTTEVGTSHAEEVASFQEFLGVELNPELCIVNLSEEGPAARAGLQQGDQLTRLDQVRLNSSADFLPRARSAVSTISFARTGYRGEGQVFVPRAGFQVLDPDVAKRALAIFLGVVVALCLAARPPRFFVWLSTKKSRAVLGPTHPLTDLGLRSQMMAYPAFLAVIVGYFVVLWVRPEFLSSVDFVLSLASAALLSSLGAFCLGGTRTASKQFSLLGALAAAWFQFIALLPLVVACVFRASELGSLRLSELAGSQGAWPHQWGVLSAPWTFLLALAGLLTLVPVSGRRAPLEGHTGSRGVAVAMGRLLEWTGQLVFIGLWIALFFGPPWSHGSAWVAALLLSLKFMLVVRGLSALRARTGRMRLGESGPLSDKLSWGLVIAASGLGSVQFFVQGSFVTQEWLQVLAISFGLSLSVLLLIGSQRSWAHGGRRGDPWI